MMKQNVYEYYWKNKSAVRVHNIVYRQWEGTNLKITIAHNVRRGRENVIYIQTRHYTNDNLSYIPFLN